MTMHSFDVEYGCLDTGTHIVVDCVTRCDGLHAQPEISYPFQYARHKHSVPIYLHMTRLRLCYTRSCSLGLLQLPASLEHSSDLFQYHIEESWNHWKYCFRVLQPSPVATWLRPFSDQTFATTLEANTSLKKFNPLTIWDQGPLHGNDSWHWCIDLYAMYTTKWRTPSGMQAISTNTNNEFQNSQGNSNTHELGRTQTLRKTICRPTVIVTRFLLGIACWTLRTYTTYDILVHGVLARAEVAFQFNHDASLMHFSHDCSIHVGTWAPTQRTGSHVNCIAH